MAEAAVEQAPAKDARGMIFIRVPVKFLTKVFNGEVMARAMDWTNAPADIEVVAVEQSINDRSHGLCKIFLQSRSFTVPTRYEKGVPMGNGYQYGTMADLKKGGNGQLPQGGRWLRKVVIPGQ